MADDTSPEVWHYGLMAERWALFNLAAPEAPFLEAQISRYGQPVLDLACGAGRLLLPLLRAGVDIDGCDVSQDMLDQCALRAAKEGLAPQLYAQPMSELALPRRYNLIYICDSFGLAGSQALDIETLRRCRAHLQPGGKLILNIEAEYANRESWVDWLEAERSAWPRPWPAEPKVQQGPDGSEYRTWFRLLALDPLTQENKREVRLQKWRGGELVAEETYRLRGRMYFHNEVLLLLRLGGFTDVAVFDGYSDRPAAASSSMLLFVAGSSKTDSAP